MSFSTSPKSTPNIPTPPGAKANMSSANGQQAQSPRDRAIAALMKPNTAAQANAHVPQVNATNVSPEEMGAITTKSTDSSGQSTTTEGVNSAESDPSVEVTKSSKEEAPLSQQYAVLARKEKALRAKVQAQEAAFKAQDAALKAREDALKSKDTEYQSNYISKDKIAKDPWMTLQELGIDYNQLTEQVLNQPQTDPATRLAIQKLEQRLEAQAKLIEESKADAQNQQKQSYQQAVNQIRSEARVLVANDPSFETIKETGSVDDVVQLIEQTFNQDGVLLSVEDACREVEDYLVEETLKLMKLNKIQKRLAPKAPVEQPASPSADSKQPQMKTLTNAVNSTKRLSARERAILAMEGKLKQ